MWCLNLTLKDELHQRGGSLHQEEGTARAEDERQARSRKQFRGNRVNASEVGQAVCEGPDVSSVGKKNHQERAGGGGRGNTGIRCDVSSL